MGTGKDYLKRWTPPSLRRLLRRVVPRRPDTGPPQADNIAFNRFYWDRYARSWSGLLANDSDQFEHPLEVLGDEWATPRMVREVVERFILPHVSKESTVVEVGSGGGRVARHVAANAGEFWCVDISEGMLERARGALAGFDNVRYELVHEARLPADLHGRVDFLYSFDVFVHLDLHTQWRYIEGLSTALRPGARAFIHTANLTTDLGWARFASQDRYNVADYYFVSPEIVRTLIARAGLELLEEAGGDSDNTYLRQDYLALVRRPAEPSE